MTVLSDTVSRSTPMGANLAEGGATFRTWAPRAVGVYLLTGDALASSAAAGFAPDTGDRLTPLGDGTWGGFLPGATDGIEYLFWIDGPAGQGPKRDPYARELTVTPAFPDSYAILRDPESYPWHDAAWIAPDFSRLVIYQLHVGTWWAVDANGADVRATRGGRFLDVATRLDYLVDLGVNAIQLLPIQEFATEFSEGYNGVDYFSPEQLYQAASDADLLAYLGAINASLTAAGAAALTLDEIRPGINQLKCLIDLAHLKGVAVIFDLVYNHAGGGFDDHSLYFYDRLAYGNQNDSLYFTDEGWAGGLVFAYWNANVRQFLIDNATAFFKEYRIDGIRYDEVRVISDNRPSGVTLCQNMTDTLRFIRASAIQIAEYWDWDRAFPVTPTPGGLGFDAALGDAFRDSARSVLTQAAGGEEAQLQLEPVAAALYTPAGYDAAWRLVQCIENHDITYANHDGAARVAYLADPADSGLLVRPQPRPGRNRAPVRGARHSRAVHGSGDPRGQALVRRREGQSRPSDLVGRPEVRSRADGLPPFHARSRGVKAQPAGARRRGRARLARQRLRPGDRRPPLGRGRRPWRRRRRGGQFRRTGEICV